MIPREHRPSDLGYDRWIKPTKMNPNIELLVVSMMSHKRWARMMCARGSTMLDLMLGSIHVMTTKSNCNHVAYEGS